MHPRKHELAKFETFFGCPVRFGRRQISLVFSRRQLALPIASADARLLRMSAWRLLSVASASARGKLWSNRPSVGWHGTTGVGLWERFRYPKGSARQR
jgi:hypothetical protein